MDWICLFYPLDMYGVPTQLPVQYVPYQVPVRSVPICVPVLYPWYRYMKQEQKELFWIFLGLLPCYDGNFLSSPTFQFLLSSLDWQALNISSQMTHAVVDPSILLPRDETGSYLHLKLKRFPSIHELSMPYAKKTWKDHPQDADIDMSPSNRSKCRQCHSVIHKGDLRVRLWLQCHKGCKNGAYFHGKDCIWQYPETEKLDSVKAFVGIENVPKDEQIYVQSKLEKLLKETGGKKSGASSTDQNKRKKEHHDEDTSEVPVVRAEMKKRPKGKRN